MPDTMRITLHSDQIMEISDSGGPSLWSTNEGGANTMQSYTWIFIQRPLAIKAQSSKAHSSTGGETSGVVPGVGVGAPMPVKVCKSDISSVIMPTVVCKSFNPATWSSSSVILSWSSAYCITKKISTPHNARVGVGMLRGRGRGTT